jgi:23S rRNA (cytosine1962-C5)-methyltransferase
VFSYQGWFAVQVARKATAVVAVDSSRDALAALRRNADANGVTVDAVEDNAFDRLRALDGAGERFDAVLLDPPAFAKNRRDRPAAMRGYKEVNLRAMRVLRERGILVTSSCSYHLGEAEFLDVVADAAADAGRTFRVLERRSQAPDHPILLAFPESRYLKCLVLGLT